LFVVLKILMVKKSLFSLTLIFLLFLPRPVPASDVEFPLVQSFSCFPYMKNGMLPEGQQDFTVDIGYSNTFMFSYDRDVVNDFDTFTATVGYRRGILKNLVAEFYLRAGVLYGGIMDKLIEDFHRLIGNGEDGRGEYERNRVHFKYKEIFSYEKAQPLTGPFIAGILTPLHDGADLDIHFRASLGIPLTERTGIRSGKPFLTAGVIALYRKKGFSLDMSLYASFFKPPDWAVAENVRSRMFFFNVHGAYKKIWGGFLFRSTPFRTTDLSNPASQIYIGYRISDHISIAMYEEIPPMDTVTDVTFRILLEF